MWTLITPTVPGSLLLGFWGCSSSIFLHPPWQSVQSLICPHVTSYCKVKPDFLKHRSWPRHMATKNKGVTGSQVRPLQSPCCLLSLSVMRVTLPECHTFPALALPLPCVVEMYLTCQCLSHKNHFLRAAHLASV